MASRSGQSQPPSHRWQRKKKIITLENAFPAETTPSNVALADKTTLLQPISRPLGFSTPIYWQNNTKNKKKKTEKQIPPTSSIGTLRLSPSDPAKCRWVVRNRTNFFPQIYFFRSVDLWIFNFLSSLEIDLGLIREFRNSDVFLDAPNFFSWCDLARCSLFKLKSLGVHWESKIDLKYMVHLRCFQFRSLGIYGTLKCKFSNSSLSKLLHAPWELKRFNFF